MMNKQICFGMPLVTLLIALSQAAFGETSINGSSVGGDDRIPVFYVLLRDDRNYQKSDHIVTRAGSGARSGFSVSALNDQNLRDVRRIFPSSRYDDARKNFTEGEEPARSKLGRYLVVEYERGSNIDEIESELNADSNVEAVYVDRLIKSSSICDSPEPGTPVSYTSFSKTWGFSKVRASQGWAYATGHAYIGVVDLGVEMVNADIKDFSGNTFLFGNFHPHLAFDVGNRVDDDGTMGNPFTALGYIGEVDEYFVKVHPADDLDCDDSPNGNENGYSESYRAGHGSAVFGVIAANGTNAGSARGVCKHCPVAVAKAGYVSQCAYGTQPITGQDYESVNHNLTSFSVGAAAALAIDVGVQVINQSSGAEGILPSYCSSNPNDPNCLTIEYAGDRDVVWVAAAGNANSGTRINWPAIDPNVIGVMGSSPSGITRWEDSVNCGSNYGGTSDSDGAGFIAPAEGIYTTMYADMDYNAGGCHEYNDDDGSGASEEGDGYGYCTGTSLATPFVTAVAGLVKSINPLLSEDDVYTALKDSTAYGTWDDERGWGIPRTDYALKEALGIVGGVQVRNRAVPLFNLYGETGEDFINTTKPQVVLGRVNNYFSHNTMHPQVIIAAK